MIKTISVRDNQPTIIIRPKKNIEAEVGDLVLFYSHGRRKIEEADPILGIFGDVVKDYYLCLAEQPFSLRSVKLPSGIVLPLFVPINSPSKSRFYYKDHEKPKELEKWEYNFTISSISNLVLEKENIIEKLVANPQHRYDGHVGVIEKMNKPYVNDPKIRKRLTKNQ